MGKGCRSDRRRASDARWVKRVRDNNEGISELGRVEVSASLQLQTTRSMARCLSAVSEARGKLRAKSYESGSDDMNKVLD